MVPWSPLMLFQWILFFGLIPPTIQRRYVTSKFNSSDSSPGLPNSLPGLAHTFGFKYSDPVNFELFLICEEHPFWCAEIYVSEEDSPKSRSDAWLYGSICTNQRMANFTNVKLYPGGDGVWDNRYEVTTLIYHNCTSKQHTISKECDYPELHMTGYNTGYTSKVGTMTTCACNLLPFKSVDVYPAGSFSEIVKLDDSKNAYDAANLDSCGFPLWFQELKSNLIHFPWINPPCDWNKWNRQHGKHIINFIDNDRPGPLILNITIGCQDQQRWCADLYLSEIDNPYSSDALFYGTFCTDRRNISFSGVKIYPGSDGLLFDDGTQFIGVQIFHNCTDQTHTSDFNCPWPVLYHSPCPVEDAPSDRGNTKKCDCFGDAFHLASEKTRTVSRFYHLWPGTKAYAAVKYDTPRKYRKKKIPIPQHSACPFPNEFSEYSRTWDAPLKWFHPPCDFTGEDRKLGQYSLTFVGSDQPKFLMKEELEVLKKTMGFHDET